MYSGFVPMHVVVVLWSNPISRGQKETHWSRRQIPLNAAKAGFRIYL
jgi:hypothetical protein